MNDIDHDRLMQLQHLERLAEVPAGTAARLVELESLNPVSPSDFDAWYALLLDDQVAYQLWRWVISMEEE